MKPLKEPHRKRTKHVVEMAKSGKMTAEFVECLVEAVRKRAYLYNPRDISYHDAAKCQNAWEAIKTELQVETSGEYQLFII